MAWLEIRQRAFSINLLVHGYIREEKGRTSGGSVAVVLAVAIEQGRRMQCGAGWVMMLIRNSPTVKAGRGGIGHSERRLLLVGIAIHSFI